jgi:hypothetical protein
LTYLYRLVAGLFKVFASWLTLGIEKNIVGRFAAKQAAKETAEQTVAKEATEQTIVGAAAREAAPEAAQAGQEQLAANLALQGEIDPRTNLPFDVPTFRGVAGQAALEGLLGAGLGAGVEVAGRVTEKPEPAPPSTEEEREAFERELTPEEQLKAQLARQQAGQQILEGIKQDVGTDLDQLDADTQAAVDEYEKAKPKPTRKKISLKEQAADREAYEKGDMSLAEFTAKYEGADLESTDTGVGLEGGEQATGAPDTTGAETPDATGVAGVDQSVTPAGTGEGATSTAIDPVVVVKNSEENLQQKNDKKAEIQQKLAAAKAKKKDVAAGKLPIGAEDFDYEIGQLESELAKVEDETSMIETYETVRQTLGKSEKNKPWEDLSADERMVYEDALGKDIVYGLDQEPDVVEEFESKTKEELEGELGRRRAAKTQRLKDKTAEELEDIVLGAIGELTAYRKAKGEGKGLKNTAIAAYEINRKAESNYRGLDLPRWTVLPEEAKQAFLDKVFSPNESSPSYAGPSYEIQQEGFDAIQEIVGEQLASRRPELEETVRQQESEAAAQQRAVVEGQEDQLSLGQKLPGDVVEAIKDGDTKSVIEYLRKQAKGRPGLFDKVTSRINRLVAGTVGAIDLNTKIEYVDTEDFIADYDAKRDVIRISNRGLNEVAVLHELVHAATVKTISDVLAGREKDPAKVDAVKRLKLMMNYSKKTLGKRYSRAYKDIYEFVAYAMSDPKFQAELQKISVPQDFTKYSDWKDENLWGEFVRLIADTIGLVERFAKAITIKTGMNNLFKKFDTKKLKDAPQDLQEDAEAFEDITFEELANTLKETPRSHPLFKKSDKTVEKYAQVVQKIKSAAEKVKAEFEADFKKATGKEPRGKDYDNPPKELVPLQKRISTETNKLRQEEKQVRAEVEKVNEELREEGLEAFEIDLTDAEQKADDVNLMTPGYLGNLFLEVAGIFDAIVAAPPEGGILLFENSPDTILPMAGGKPGAKPKPLPKISADKAAAEAKTRLIKKTEEAETGAFKQFGRAVMGIFTKQGYTNLVRKVQNRLVDFQNKERELDRLGKLVMVGTEDEVNDINTKYNSAVSIAQNKSNLFKELTDEAIDSVRLIMKATKKSYAETLADLQMYMTGLHDMERRLELFYRNVPLTDAALTERIRIYEELSSKSLIELRNKNQRAADTIVRKLKQRLVKLTTDPSNYLTGIDAEKLTPGGYMYNPLGYDIDVANKFKDTYKNASPEVKAELEKLFGTDSKPGLLKQVIDKSAELNREANYFTNAVENVIKFYGYKHYFPFKGRGDTDTASKLDMADPFVSDRLGGDFKQGETTFMGRQSDADNPFLQVFTEATKSAMRAGFKDVPHTMKNLINKKEVAGKLKKTITFQERSAPGFKWSEAAGQNDFFVYKADGSVDIYEINDPNMRRAFKGLYKTEQPMVELANKVTSTIGSFHTRYNPAFAPLDFVRNLMTYAGIVGLRFGPKTAGQLYAAMGKVIAQGGMHKTFVFTKAFAKGDKKVLDTFKKSPKGSYYRDISRYYELGGQVAYMDSLTNSQALESMGKELQRDPRYSPKKWATYFDAWMAMFETTSRVATFRTLKEKFMSEKIPEAEAEQRAMSIAKDLANFQQVGEIGKELGSLFMFWRPAATGAVKAIDALIPAFDLRSRDDLVKLYKTKPNTTDTQAQRAADVYLTEVKNARVMSTVLAGAGFFTYTMAHMMGGEDDEGRNKAETDDMARWVRFARFNLGTEVTGRDLVFQVPWGFGPGAIASAGAQMAAVAYGGQDLMRAGLNITSAGFESFVPLPISKIDPIANPTLFVVDSVMPSVLRPLLQFAANTDGLGRKIYTDRQSRYADAYLGGDNVPAMYKDAVRFMFEATDGMVDMSPGTAYFLANNYVDGASRVLATTYNLTDVIRGQKEFDIRTDSFLLDSYFKAPANYDAIQFSRAENKIKELDKRIKALQNTPQFGDFLEDYPMAPGMVNFYNKVVNGALRNLRTQANQVRRSDMSQKEKNDMLQMLNKQQNQIKRAFLTAIEGLETGYTGYEE